MEAEVSLFETSETMASFLGSTGLLMESWRFCSTANATLAPPSGPGFIVTQVGSVGYIAFSGAQIISGSDLYVEDLVPVNGVGGGIFTALDCHGAVDGDEEEEPVMVHKGLLHLFLNIYSNLNFQIQVKAIMEQSKSIVLTGHSIGGSIASLMALSWLCYLETTPPPPSTQILCITFGSPLLGNKSLSRALLRQRWAGSFCHVVSKDDIVPRLLFAPLGSFNAQLHCLLQYWQLSITSPRFGSSALQIPEEDKSRLLGVVLAYTESQANAPPKEEAGRCSFWPCGSYVFCSEEGAVCVDNAVAVVKLLHLMLTTATPKSCVEDHLMYGEHVERVSLQFLYSKDVVRGNLPELSYEAGMVMALESMGLDNQESISESAIDCLKMAKQMGLTPNLNSAKLAISLSRITPYRVQIMWYKASCDRSDDQMGYYDSFKQRQASKRDSQVNMFRLKLATFWNGVIAMMDDNKLPHDFHTRAKWVNASHFYQLLVEPLDIADYYRSGAHLTRGHYMAHGRERRHQIIDKWWRGRRLARGSEGSKRSKFAGLTEDPCFWARVEEARELLERARRERSSIEVWTGIEAFERYSREMVESKEVSQDVLAKNSSYSIWVEELAELRVRAHQFPSREPGFLDGKLMP
ncbi:hypothetical protein V2J09_023575 [Rumex salicifolius]